MKRKAIVYKDASPKWKSFPWHWLHECNGLLEPGGYLRKEGGGYKTHAAAFLSAWMHTATCQGVRIYFDN